MAPAALGEPMDRLFCAIDNMELERACALTRQLRGTVGGIKLGLEFVIQHGEVGLADLAALGMPLMVDAKICEIPRFVGNVVRRLSAQGVSYVTIHAAVGAPGMRAAMAAAISGAEGGGRARTRVIAATVLPGTSDEDLAALGIHDGVENEILRLAALARDHGLDGVWAPANTVEMLRQHFGDEFLLVTPGIRPVWAPSDDQPHILTPGDAVRGGTDILVVGRPITRAKDPLDAARRIAEEATAAAL